MIAVERISLSLGREGDDLVDEEARDKKWAFQNWEGIAGAALICWGSGRFSGT